MRPKALIRIPRFMQHGTSAATVGIRVHDLAQVFNSLDPSPFWDRDLAWEAAEFIEGEFRDKLSARVWHLYVHTHEGAALAGDLQPALEHYYGRLAASTRRRLRDQIRYGQLALLGGIAIFLISTAARGVVTRVLGGAAPRILDEGLIILAWLALWRPAESLVYGWVPLFRERRLYERLAAIRVSVRVDDSHPQAPHLEGTIQPGTAAGKGQQGGPAR
jgi:hypothetical protein